MIPDDPLLHSPLASRWLRYLRTPIGIDEDVAVEDAQLGDLGAVVLHHVTFNMEPPATAPYPGKLWALTDAALAAEATRARACLDRCEAAANVLRDPDSSVEQRDAALSTLDGGSPDMQEKYARWQVAVRMHAARLRGDAEAEALSYQTYVNSWRPARLAYLAQEALRCRGAMPRGRREPQPAQQEAATTAVA